VASHPAVIPVSRSTDADSLINVDADPAAWSGVARRLEAARAEFNAQAQRFEEAKSQLQATADSFRTGHPRRERLYYSAYARLQARLDTMPVIEQAKGILMAHQRCGPDEAFDLLRLASQRANVKVHVLAEQMIAQLGSQEAESDARPQPLAGSAHL
jgi:ANTAR domain